MQQPTIFRFNVLQLKDQATLNLKDQLAELADTCAGELLLDFAQVEWISSTALSMLIGLHRRLSRSEGHLALRNVSEALMELFRLTRLDSLLDIRAARPNAGHSMSALA